MEPTLGHLEPKAVGWPTLLLSYRSQNVYTFFSQGLLNSLGPRSQLPDVKQGLTSSWPPYRGPSRAQPHDKGVWTSAIWWFRIFSGAGGVYSEAPMLSMLAAYWGALVFF